MGSVCWPSASLRPYACEQLLGLPELTQVSTRSPCEDNFRIVEGVYRCFSPSSLRWLYLNEAREPQRTFLSLALSVSQAEYLRRAGRVVLPPPQLNSRLSTSEEVLYPAGEEGVVCGFTPVTTPVILLVIFLEDSVCSANFVPRPFFGRFASTASLAFRCSSTCWRRVNSSFRCSKPRLSSLGYTPAPVASLCKLASRKWWRPE